jgi:hypothetical protein
MKLSPKLKAAATRAIRTGAQTFFGVVCARWLAGSITVTALVDAVALEWDMAGGAAILSAAGALGWNVYRPISPEVT